MAVELFRGVMRPCPLCGRYHRMHSLEHGQDTLDPRHWLYIMAFAEVYGVRTDALTRERCEKLGVPCHADIGGRRIVRRRDAEVAVWLKFRSASYTRWPDGTEETTGRIRMRG